MRLYLSEKIKKYFAGLALSLDQHSTQIMNHIMALRGDCFRHQKGRLTQRIALEGNTYFIKQHSGIGWMEIIKNIAQCRLPVWSAKNEWLAIQKLQSLGVPVPAVMAHGVRGWNPARLQSFILMEALTPTISLEELCQTWQTQPPSFAVKQKLIEEVARIARLLHQNGLNHRDFYICHFLLDTSHGIEQINTKNIKLYLIDLHRAQIRRFVPKRWIIKDLAGLYFSSKDIGLTQRDLYRFMSVYQAVSRREVLRSKTRFWQKVKARGEQLYRDHTQ